MSKISVAIADDNERMVSLIKEILGEDNDIEVVGTADNGLDALKIIEEKEPDVMVLDLIMPKLDGLGLMERVKETRNGKKNPAFIVVTAVGHDRVTENAFELGAAYYLMKPFDNNTLLSRVKQTMAVSKTKLIEADRKSTYENKEDYAEKNLELDVTNIIHEIGPLNKQALTAWKE